MSKKAAPTADQRKAKEAAQARHKAAGWHLVVFPGGKRRMMTAAEREAEAAK